MQLGEVAVGLAQKLEPNDARAWMEKVLDEDKKTYPGAVGC